MPAVLMAEGCREIDIGAVRHYAGMTGRGRDYAKGGIFRDMTDTEAKAVVAAGGAVIPAGGPQRGQLGYRCPCGFAPYFSPCSRCGRDIASEERQ